MDVRISATGERGSILIVDDIELNRTLIDTVLSGAGYEVNSVADGAAAISAVDAKAYDLVLMDLDMPGVDGFQATKAIRAKKDSLPIVALTSRNSQHEKDRALEVGMKAHVSRPIAASALVKVVEDLMSATTRSRAKVFRPEVQNEIASRLGLERTRLFLDALLDQCRTTRDLIARGENDLNGLDRKAHDLASTAGMLGYEELWHRCRDLLVAPDETTRANAIEPVGAALVRAIAKIEDQLSVEDTAAA